MRHYFLFLFFIFLMSSCKSTEEQTSSKVDIQQEQSVPENDPEISAEVKDIEPSIPSEAISVDTSAADPLIQKMLWQYLDLPSEVQNSDFIPLNGSKRVLLLQPFQNSLMNRSGRDADASLQDSNKNFLYPQEVNQSDQFQNIEKHGITGGLGSEPGRHVSYHPYLLENIKWWQQPALKLAPMTVNETFITSNWIPSVRNIELENLLHEAHESMEGGHSMDPGLKGKLQEWVHNFNIHDFVLNGYRWIQMKKMDPRFKNDALNVAFLFGISHGIETMAGPTALVWAQNAGVGPAEMGLIGSVGFLISIPGLDPLCMVLASFYKSNDQFRRLITQLRIVTVKTGKGVSDLTGISAIFDRAFAIRPAKQRLAHWLEQKNQSNIMHSEDILPLMKGVTLKFEKFDHQILATELADTYPHLFILRTVRMPL